MSAELTVSLTLAFVKAACQSVTEGLSKTLDVSGGYTTKTTQLIGTTDETVTLSADMGTVGYVVFQNLDATNYILIGADGSSYPIKLLPGEIALLRFNGTIHAKANTAACKLGVVAIESMIDPAHPEDGAHDAVSSADRIAQRRAQRAAAAQADQPATHTEVERMIEARVEKLKVTGPTVQGSARNGWVVGAQPGGGNGASGTKRVIIVDIDAGTAAYYDITATYVGPV